MRNPVTFLFTLVKRLDTVNSELECPICKELLARPLAIYPCGHIFCEDCLLQTFFTPVAGEDPETTPATRDKYCPDCRASIHTPPAPVYLVKNIISLINPDIDKDGSRTNGFGTNLGFGDEVNADPWGILFPEDMADGMTLTSESDADDRIAQLQLAELQGSSETWDAAVNYLIPQRTRWDLVADITPDASEASGDEEEANSSQETSSNSSNGTGRLNNVRSLFSPESSDTDIRSGLQASTMDSDEEGDNSDAMEVEQDIDGFHPRHHNEQYLMQMYKQQHRIPSPIRNHRWVTRTHEPPAFPSPENEQFMSPQEKCLHQRGIPLDMQDKFQLAYTNRLGLSVQLGLGNVIFLGWNVRILWNMGDRSGEIFMAYIRWEMRKHPERWNIHIHSDGSWDAHRLRCVIRDTGDLVYTSLDDYASMEGSDTE